TRRSMRGGYRPGGAGSRCRWPAYTPGPKPDTLSPPMRCPYCGQNKDKVIDSRETDGAASIRRRRQCLHCGKRFTTYEHVESTTRLSVIKKDGSRVPYDRQKIATGVEAACYKRPIPAEQLQALIEEV